MVFRTLEELPGWVSDNPQFGAVLYLLGGGLLPGRGAIRYFDAMEAEIDWVGLLAAAAGWSSAEQLLVALACELGGAGRLLDAPACELARPTAGTLVARLDADTLQGALTAVAIAGGLTTLTEQLDASGSRL